MILGIGYLGAMMEREKLPIALHDERVGNDQEMKAAIDANDIIGFSAGVPGPGADDALAERVAFVRAAAGHRYADVEFNIAITAVPTDASGVPDLTLTRAYLPQATDEQLLALPSVLSGSPHHIAETLMAQRERYGMTYFTVQDYHGKYFADVIKALR